MQGCSRASAHKRDNPPHAEPRRTGNQSLCELHRRCGGPPVLACGRPPRGDGARPCWHAHSRKTEVRTLHGMRPRGCSTRPCWHASGPRNYTWSVHGVHMHTCRRKRLRCVQRQVAEVAAHAALNASTHANICDVHTHTLRKQRPLCVRRQVVQVAAHAALKARAHANICVVHAHTFR